MIEYGNEVILKKTSWKIFFNYINTCDNNLTLIRFWTSFFVLKQMGMTNFYHVRILDTDFVVLKQISLHHVK